MPRFEATPSIKAEPHQTSSPAGSIWSPGAGFSLGCHKPPCAPQGRAAPVKGVREGAGVRLVPGSQCQWQSWTCWTHEPWSCIPCELPDWKLEKKQNNWILKKKFPQKQYKEKDLHSLVPSNITIKLSNFAYVYFYSTDACWIFNIVMSLVPFCLCFEHSLLYTETNSFWKCLWHTNSPYLQQKRWLRDNSNSRIW